jgi:hypothetical protein
MNIDTSYAAKTICADLDRLISSLEGMRLHNALEDMEALELAIFDLINAKAMVLLALVNTEVAH